MKFHRYIILLGSVFSSFLGNMQGQAVVGFSPGSTAVGAPITQPQRTSRSPAPLSSIRSAFANSGPLFKRGPLAIRPRLGYNWTYGNGILRVPGEPENTSIHDLNAGVTADLGSSTSFDYSVSRSDYESRLLTDTTSYNARASTESSPGTGDWRFGVTVSYGSNAPTLVETGGQTYEKTFSSRAEIGYHIGPRSDLEFNVNRHVRRANPLNQPTTWTGSDWTQWASTGSMSYRISAVLKLGAGLGLGYDEIKFNPDMTYTQPYMHVTWAMARKLSFNGQVGTERRKTRGQKDSRENTTYSASLGYQPLPTTSVSLSANRNVSASYFANQVSVSESQSLSVQQRLFTRFFGSASFTRGRSEYLPTINVPFEPRNDRFESFSISLATSVLTRGNLGLSLNRSRNLSNSRSFGFTARQISFSFIYGF